MNVHDARARSLSLSVLSMAALALACGGGRPGNGSARVDSSTVTVRVSAGTPVAGATVTVYAVTDDDGQVNTAVGAKGVLGVAGPTDASGSATVTLTMPGYSGPLQVSATGTNLSYADPSTAAAAGSATSGAIQIPAGFVLSSYYPNYSAGTAITIPCTLLTTLADHEAIAYARGKHAQHPGKKTLTAALADRDRLFVTHIVRSGAWDPKGLRSTVPASLTAGPQTLNDVAYAALFDVALGQLAHATAAAAGYPAGSNSINAVTLTQILEQDVDADGVLDGRGEGGVVLATTGTTPVVLTSQFLRIPLAKALDGWIQSKSGNASGIAQADLVSSGVFASMSEDASDLFGAPPESTYDPRDAAAPELAFVTEPARYLAGPAGGTMTFTLSASDPSGVARVWCAVEGVGSAVSAAKQPDGSWKCTLTLANAVSVVKAWGEDGATPSNSGASLAAPYLVTRTVTFDNAVPGALYAALPSYFDERGIALAMNGPVPAVPAEYRYASATKVGVATNGQVYKIASRLGWTTQPTASVLENANPDNIPFLQFTVPFNAATEAPITSATYRVAIPGFPDATGSLWPAARTDPAGLVFDFPLASNLVPALAQVTGPAAMTLSITLTDAAGNSSTTTPAGTLTFHVLGPPLIIAEDGAYPAAGDPKSASWYTLASARYAQLFDATVATFRPEEQVRLIRYLVTNPGSKPVAIAPALVGSGFSASEDWNGDGQQMGLDYTLDGFTYAASSSWSVTAGSEISSKNCMADCAGTARGPAHPCLATLGTDTAFHTPGSPVQYGCGPGHTSPPANMAGHVEAAGSPLLVAYSAASAGFDATPAQVLPGGQVVVPPAANGVAGSVALYVVRPRVTARTVPLAYGRVNPSASTPLRFEYHVEDAYLPSVAAVSSACMVPGRTGLCMVNLWLSYQTHVPWRWVRYLSGASEQLNGSLSISSYGVVESGSSSFGEPSAVVQNLTLARTIVH